MPFPLAHPAAVLPLRRYAPKLFSFPALIVGSVAPDAAYCLRNTRVEEFSHSFWGCFGFSLPIGLLMLAAVRAACSWVLPVLPARYRRKLEPLSCFRFGPILLVITSLLVGAWTHVLWDSFTHNQGWFALHSPVLQTIVTMIGERHIRVCHLLWYASSYAGVAIVYLSFHRWRKAQRAGETVPDDREVRNPRNRTTTTKSDILRALLVASLVIPIELMHHLVRGWLGAALVAVSSLLLVLGVVLREE